MRYIINLARDVEEILLEELREYFEIIRWDEIYPNFKGVRVSGIHPMALVTNAEINNEELSVEKAQSYFPCVVLVEDNDARNQELMTPTDLRHPTISSSEVADIMDNRSRYIISDKDLQELRELTKSGGTVFAEGTITHRRASIVVEIWSFNRKVKNDLYTVVRQFFHGPLRFTLSDTYDIVVLEHTLNGQKSGNYNFDFGRMLHGAFLRFEIDHAAHQYIIDTETVQVSKVDHTVEDISHAG